LMSLTISIFATIALFCYVLSGEVSSESPVICSASSTVFFYFVGEPFFGILKQKKPSSKKDTTRAGKSNPSRDS
jgi:hypothetical protein